MTKIYWQTQSTLGLFIVMCLFSPFFLENTLHLSSWSKLSTYIEQNQQSSCMNCNNLVLRCQEPSEKRATDAQWSLFFIKTQNFWQTNLADKLWGIWSIFSQTLSTRFGTLSPSRIYKEGLTERAIILCKLNKSLLESSKSVGIHSRQGK